MTETRITFGVQYAHKTHPTFPAAHPDGYVTIEADVDTARRAAHMLFGRAWAFTYPAAEFDAARWAPRGQLWRVDDTTARVLAAAFVLLAGDDVEGEERADRG